MPHWSGRGVEARWRPLTLHSANVMIIDGMNRAGDITPDQWSIPRDAAEELAASMADSGLPMYRMNGGAMVTAPSALEWLASMESGECKLLGVPIRVEAAPKMLDVELPDGSVVKMRDCRGQETELRPPPEHADKPLHWVQDDGCDPEVAFWECPDDSGDRCMWRLADDGQWSPTGFGVRGYRYLGPAEYRPGVLAVPAEVTQCAENQRRIIAAREAQIGVLIRENAALSKVQPGASVVRIRELEAQNARLVNEVASWESAYRTLRAEFNASGSTPRCPEGSGDGANGGAVKITETAAAAYIDFSAPPAPPPQKPTAKPLPDNALRHGPGLPRV